MCVLSNISSYLFINCVSRNYFRRKHVNNIRANKIESLILIFNPFHIYFYKIYILIIIEM